MDTFIFILFHQKGEYILASASIYRLNRFSRLPSWVISKRNMFPWEKMK